MTTIRLTTEQISVRVVKHQLARRDGQEMQSFAGIVGTFGHGIVVGVMPSMQEHSDFRYFLVSKYDD